MSDSDEFDAGTRTLDPSHHWGRRPYFVRTAPGSNRLREQRIPCCLNCLVDGFEDEPAAFEPCRRQGETRVTPPGNSEPT